MKKLITLTLFSLILFGCNEANTTKKQNSGWGIEETTRIVGKGSIIYQNRRFTIIEVDGKEYLSSTDGGLCPLTK